MNDTSITFRGYAGTEVRHRQTREANVATVRVASTPRVRKDGEWVDGPTTWYAVTAWRTLADHLRDSVRKGDPLIVHGRLRTESWQPEGGGTATSLQVDALLIGHDLNRGITHFMRRRTEQPAADPSTEADELAGEAPEGADVPESLPEPQSEPESEPASEVAA